MEGLEAAPTWTDEGLFAVALATFVVLLAGGSFAVRQLRAATKHLALVQVSTGLETLSLLAGRWDSDLLIEARRLVNKNSSTLARCLNAWDRKDATEYYAAMALLGFFEELGYLYEASDGGVFRRHVKAIFSSPVRHYFGLFLPYICEKRRESPEIAEHFEGLAETFS